MFRLIEKIKRFFEKIKLFFKKWKLIIKKKLRNWFWTPIIALDRFLWNRWLCILKFSDNNPEYFDFRKKRTKVEKANIRGVFWWILTIIVWFDLLGLGLNTDKSNRFIMWDLAYSIFSIHYFFYVAKGFRGLWTNTKNQWHWYGTFAVSIYELLGFMYENFRWEDYLSSKKPFAYIIWLVHISLMKNKKTLFMLGFGMYTLEEFCRQWWRSLCIVYCWYMIKYLIDAFFYIFFGIQLWWD